MTVTYNELNEYVCAECGHIARASDDGVCSECEKDEINKSQTHLMLHALGIEYEPRRGCVLVPGRRCRPLPRAYRNHYQIEDDYYWNVLVRKGFAKKLRNMDMNFYVVTENGIDKLKRLGYLFKVTK